MHLISKRDRRLGLERLNLRYQGPYDIRNRWPMPRSYHVPFPFCTATAPDHFHLVVLDHGAFHKARSLRLPPNVGLLFLPPSAPELHPIERLWRDLTDWLAAKVPTTFNALSTLLTARLQYYTPARVRSLTGFPSFVAATSLAHGYSS